LAAAGVKLTQSVELVSDGLGGIAVAGDHLQKAEIERAISGDVILQRDFSRLAADVRELSAGRGMNDHPADFAITVPTL
jgi:hypothetical protein